MTEISVNIRLPWQRMILKYSAARWGLHNHPHLALTIDTVCTETTLPFRVCVVRVVLRPRVLRPEGIINIS